MAASAGASSLVEARPKSAPALPRIFFLRAGPLTLVLRIFYSLLAFCLAPSLRLDSSLIHTNSLTEHLLDRAPNPLLYGLVGVWQRFDTLWYVDIARHGYLTPASTVFYPLYPILIRLLSFGEVSAIVSALLVSTAASYLCFRGLEKLFESEAGEAGMTRGLLLWAVWPASFTFFAGYPDSLVCALVIWAIWFARKNDWERAGVLGLFAGLAKALGCLSGLPLLWLAWRRKSWKGAAAAMLSFAGTAAFQCWLRWQNFPPAGEVYRKFWVTETAAPWTTLFDAIGALGHGNLLVEINLIVLVVTAVAAMIPGVRAELRIFSLAAVTLFLTKHTAPLLQSMTRYSLMLFAAFPLMGERLSGAVFALAACLAFAVNLFFFRVFLDWGLVV